MQRYICIHCHFYQPARENPWLESIEQQDTSYPYHDWNERVTAEAYAPNAASRILDEQGRIIKIVNNYSRISFNFGATLLAWMKEKAADTYEAVLDADRASQKSFSGHGSAIAQGHGHMILPLASSRDKETQVLWGIRDFEHHFGRSPEGMWLPEAAVDVETLEVLAANGIKFTILSPYQAAAVRRLGSTQWEDVSHGRIDPTRSYVSHLPSGRSIALFFYDGPISRAVAFERLLSRSENLIDRLMGGFSEARNGAQLMNIATDGETYGHHHRFGDMALAYALDRLENDPDVALTNYGEFLERYPPQYEATIYENTSWSCAHGIERWRANCGCSTHDAGHQEWREPLREALDFLRDAVAPKYEKLIGQIVNSPWDARNDYIEVINDRSDASVNAFFRRNSPRELSDEETVTALRLLELQRYAQLMYTSCGWFFADVSGIETIQVILYAARVLQLARELFGDDTLEQKFLAILEKAVSNVPSYVNGRVIYEKHVKPAVVDLSRVAAHYAVSSLFEEYGDESKVYGYTVEREEGDTLEAGRARVLIGRARVRSDITRYTRVFSYGILYLGDLNVSGGVRHFSGVEAYSQLRDELSLPFNEGDFPSVIRELDKHFGALTFSMKSLFRDEQRKILQLIWNNTLQGAEASYRQLYDDYRPLMRYYTDLAVPLPQVMKLTAEAALNLTLLRAFERDDLPVGRIERLLQEAKRATIPIDASLLTFTFQKTIERLGISLEEDPEDLTRLKRLDAAVSLAQRLPFPINKWKVQNTYYRILQTTEPKFEELASKNELAEEWMEHFRAVGEKLSVRDEDEV